MGKGTTKPKGLKPRGQTKSPRPLKTGGTHHPKKSGNITTFKFKHK
jgi:hypothetical protein